MIDGFIYISYNIKDFVKYMRNMEELTMLKRLTAFLLVFVLLVSFIQTCEAVTVLRLKKGYRGTDV